MLVARDADGVWHEVYNKTEIRQLSSRLRVENWQIRTLCSTYEMHDSFRPGIARATLDEGVRRDALDEDVRRAILSDGHAVTCVRCAALECDHGVTFDEIIVNRQQIASTHVRNRWPRLNGTCPKGCGYHGIAYASRAHYVYGDW